MGELLVTSWVSLIFICLSITLNMSLLLRTFLTYLLVLWPILSILQYLFPSLSKRVYYLVLSNRQSFFSFSLSLSFSWLLRRFIGHNVIAFHFIPHLVTLFYHLVSSCSFFRQVFFVDWSICAVLVSDSWQHCRLYLSLFHFLSLFLYFSVPFSFYFSFWTFISLCVSTRLICLSVFEECMCTSSSIYPSSSLFLPLVFNIS